MKILVKIFLSLKKIPIEPILYIALFVISKIEEAIISLFLDNGGQWTWLAYIFKTLVMEEKGFIYLFFYYFTHSLDNCWVSTIF